MEVVIIGAGSMGRWFADVTAGWLDPVFVDANQQQAIEAANKFQGAASQITHIDESPIVCTAVPLLQTPEIIESHGGLATHAVIDLSGSMEESITAMRRVAPDLERISIHPLFSPANEPGNIAMVTENRGDITETLRERFTARNNYPFSTTVTEHDTAMETVQAKTHAAILAYALAADKVPDEFHTPISSELSELARTVLGGSAEVYGDIQTRFAGANEIAAAAQSIAASDREEFLDLYRTAASDIEE